MPGYRLTAIRALPAMSMMCARTARTSACWCNHFSPDRNISIAWSRCSQAGNRHWQHRPSLLDAADIGRRPAVAFEAPAQVGKQTFVVYELHVPLLEAKDRER